MSVKSIGLKCQMQNYDLQNKEIKEYMIVYQYVA